MKFRLARHTTKLEPIINFYCNILGFEQLGEFKNHDGYDGVFIGKKGLDWHLEFTVSNDAPQHHPDEDDLLVFYISSSDLYQQLREKLKANGINEVKPKNPYWKINGATYPDPDDFFIVLAKDWN